MNSELKKKLRQRLKKGIMRYAEEGKTDITNPEHFNAALDNYCKYIKEKYTGSK